MCRHDATRVQHGHILYIGKYKSVGAPSLISLMVSVDVKHHVFLPWVQHTIVASFIER